MAVTQSGATGSVLRLLDQARDEDIFRVVVTNEAGSEAVRRADLAYVTRAGPESAIPATKTFTSALLALRVFGIEWTAACGAAGAAAGRPGAAAAGMRELRRIPDLLREAIAQGPAVGDFIGAVQADRTWFFLGSGRFLPLASEGALKMMETAAVPAIALRTEELAHGPFALINRETPVVMHSGAGPASPGEARSLRAVSDAGAPLLRLACAGAAGEAPGSEAGRTIRTTGDPSLRPFSAAPILQLLALFAGRQLGRDVDAPAGLQKAVHDD